MQMIWRQMTLCADGNWVLWTKYRNPKDGSIRQTTRWITPDDPYITRHYPGSQHHPKTFSKPSQEARAA